MDKAKEILDKHLKEKNITDEHIHVAAYTSCLDAINEALGNRCVIMFPWDCTAELKLISTTDSETGRKDMKWSIKTDDDYKEGFSHIEDAVRHFFGS